jgi:hypothetical protein
MYCFFGKGKFAMSCLKNAAKIVVLLLLLSSVCVVVIYFTLLTPQKRAIKHLGFIHQSITEMHPAVLDASALDFQTWHKTAYESTKALLPSVHSVADERALLNYYFAGYKDSHLAGYLADSIYSLFERPTEQWAGWLMAATASGYEVIYSLGGDLYPEVGMQLISCDNQPIDELLQSRYAPYIDMRWSLLIARDQVVKALTQQREGYEVLARPYISQCAFKRTAGKEVYFPFAWQPLGETNKRHINSLNFKKYTFPSLTYKENNVAWINVSDFKLESASAYESHQQLLKDLNLLQGNETLVFDLRLNSGGNSGFGNEILTAVFGRSGMMYLETQLVEKFGASESFYRPSWSFYWSRDYAIKQLIASQGGNSSQVKWMSAINERLKKALENNEQRFSQQEALAGLMDGSEEAESEGWNYRGKVIVITDKRCVSSCLNFMDFLKQIPQIQHWGEPTNADTVYTEVVEMWHDYHKDAYSFMVPVKQWTNRPRKDNEPYSPDIVFNGNIYDDKAVERWVLKLSALEK